MAESVGFQKATRRAIRCKIGIDGPSGSGKTLGALALARGLAEGGKIAVVDTENGSASLYADRFGFDTLDLYPPYLTRKYLDAMDMAAKAKYAVLVIDSLSHQWDGDGGILQRKDEADARPGSNHWTNWGPFTKEHNKLRAAILGAPLHIVATMRSKMAYSQTDSGGKKKVEKLGLAPIQREGMEYEFTVSWSVGMDHMAAISGLGKDRTGLFGSEPSDLADPKLVERLLNWLKDAPAEAIISDLQRKSLWTLATRLEVPEAKLREIVREIGGVESSKEIPLTKFDAIVDAVEALAPAAVTA